MGSDFWAACAFILLAGVAGWSLRGRVGRQYRDGVVDGYRLCRDADGQNRNLAFDAVQEYSHRWPELQDWALLQHLAAVRRRELVASIGRIGQP